MAEKRKNKNVIEEEMKGTKLAEEEEEGEGRKKRKIRERSVLDEWG